MRSRFNFSWDITLLLVIASFLYVCFDKVISLIALLAVSREHTNIDMVPLLKELAAMNGTFATTMISLVGTFFTIVLAGSLFKGQGDQQVPNQPQSSPLSLGQIGSIVAKAGISSKQTPAQVVSTQIPDDDEDESKLSDDKKPMITKIPD